MAILNNDIQQGNVLLIQGVLQNEPLKWMSRCFLSSADSSRKRRRLKRKHHTALSQAVCNLISCCNAARQHISWIQVELMSCSWFEGQVTSLFNYERKKLPRNSWARIAIPIDSLPCIIMNFLPAQHWMQGRVFCCFQPAAVAVHCLALLAWHFWQPLPHPSLQDPRWFSWKIYFLWKSHEVVFLSLANPGHVNK